eukprot:158134-Prymnesium_polylepis.2
MGQDGPRGGLGQARVRKRRCAVAGCRRRAPDGGQGEASSRRDRSRASPSARGSTSRTILFEGRNVGAGSAADHCTRQRTWRAVRPAIPAFWVLLQFVRDEG